MDGKGSDSIITEEIHSCIAAFPPGNRRQFDLKGDRRFNLCSGLIAIHWVPRALQTVNVD
jgi:hypothetical protein